MLSNVPRPYVVLSLALSLDGRLAPERGTNRRLGSAEDLARLRILRRWADTLIVGAETVRAIDPPMALPDARPRVVVLSRRGALSPKARAFRCDDKRPIPWLVTTSPLPRISPWNAPLKASRLRHHRLANGRDIHLPALLEKLVREGSRRIVVEGGGQTATAFLRAGLLDELVLTYVPYVLGGERNAFVMSHSFSFDDAPRFVLHVAKAHDDELFTRWRRAFSPH